MRKFFIRLFISVVTAMLIISIFNYIIDPYQFYRKAEAYRPIYFTEQRFQNPGIAKHYKADIAIIGTSMTENFLPSHVSQAFNKEAIKLSISGSTIYEQRLITQLAIKENNIDTVLWGLDFSSFKGESGQVRNEQNPFPFHLYDEVKVNDIKYLMNVETTKRSILTLVFNRTHNLLFGYDNLEKLNTWYNWVKYGEEYVLKDFERRDQYQLAPEDFVWDHIKKNADENLIQVVKDHPDINFLIFSTPCSLMTHMYFEELGIFNNQLRLKEYIYENLKDLDNVEIYDFQVAEDIVTDLNNYKDMSHYNITVNEYIINAMLEGNYRVDDENVYENTRKLKDMLVSFKNEINQRY